MLRWTIRAGIGLLAGVALRRAVGLQRVEVSGLSMWPTLSPGDRLLAWRGPVDVGDLVIVPDPRDQGRPLVKRVVGRRGRSVDVRGDNPAASTDSRTFGVVPRAGVEARVRYRYAPPERRGWLCAAAPAFPRDTLRDPPQPTGP